MSCGHHEAAWRLPGSDPFASLDLGHYGFNVMPAALPSGLEAFTDHVIPLLRRAGVFRTEYTGRTLREHYGIPRPESSSPQRARRAWSRRDSSAVPGRRG
jgi:hypothetical protein